PFLHRPQCLPSVPASGAFVVTRITAAARGWGSGWIGRLGGGWVRAGRVGRPRFGICGFVLGVVVIGVVHGLEIALFDRAACIIPHRAVQDACPHLVV